MDSDLPKPAPSGETTINEKTNSWRKLVGVFKDDADFEEAMRLGAAYRESLRQDAEPARRFEPDRYFTAEQITRMRELMSRRNTLTADEWDELEGLVNAELEATVARTDAWLE